MCIFRWINYPGEIERDSFLKSIFLYTYTEEEKKNTNECLMLREKKFPHKKIYYPLFVWQHGAMFILVDHYKYKTRNARKKHTEKQN